MTIEEVIRVCAREGMGAIAIVAGICMLWFIIKHVVVNLTKDLSSLTTTFSGFMSYVRKEHEAQLDNQNELLKQNKEVTEILRSINNRVINNRKEN